MNRISSLGLVLALALVAVVPASAQGPIGNEQYTFKIYSVDVSYYPIVQVYFRTWDQNRDPLQNVNYANVGLMVKGRNYEPTLFHPQTRQTQYTIETLQNRQEGFRTVLVLDCSLSMAGKPFADAQNALIRYVEAKRPNDQIGIIAIRDTDQGYQLVSSFEKDPTLLYQRIADIKCDGKQTRLYDSIAAAYEMCQSASQGGVSNAVVERAALSTIVVLSDGNDEGSAVARDELMNRIGQMDNIPTPIFSLAYSNASKDHFGNLEALSKGSYGRYWTHGDSQEFAATVQKIHQINRSDYVVSFRSYVPVDGGKHPFKIGLSYPSNTGRFIWDDAEFEAIDSPAQYVPETSAGYQQAQGTIPKLDNDCPYVGCDQQAPAPVASNTPAPEMPAATPAPAPAPEAAPAESAPVVTTESDEAEEEPKSFLEENGALIGMGAGILALIIAILSWVRGGSGPKAGGGTSMGSHNTPRQLGSYDDDTRT